MRGRPLNRLEVFLEKFAVTGLGYYFVIGQAAVWMLGLFRPLFPGMLQLDFARILGENEWWRLFTFLLAPPLPGTPFRLAHLFMIFGWLFFATMTISLEGLWGKLRLNLFLLLSSLGALLGGFLAYQMQPTGMDAEELARASQNLALVIGGLSFTSVFFTFAYRFPDFPIQMFFVLTVKVAWLAWAIAGFFLMQVLVLRSIPPTLMVVIICTVILPFVTANGRDLWDRHLRHRFRKKHALMREENKPDSNPEILETAAYAASRKVLEPVIEDNFEWYYEDNEEPQGPVSTDRLKRLLHDSEISPATKVWRSGMDDWEPLLNRPEFASDLPSRKR